MRTVGRDIWKIVQCDGIPSEEEVMSHWDAEPSHPVVSIFLNTYNHSGFIEDALLGCLIQQTSFPFEILVHDDASSDGTREKVKYLASKFPHIIKPIYQKDNQRALGKRPWMFQSGRAKGEFVAFCNGDDFWTDRLKLEKQVQYLRRHPEVVMTGHDAFSIDADGNVDRRPKLASRGLGRDLRPDELRLGQKIITISVCHRNVELPGAPERLLVLNGDVFMFSLLADFGGYHHHDDIGLAAYRRHDGGIWSSLSAEKKLDAKKDTFFWITAYYKRIGKKDIAEIFEREYMNIALRLKGLALEDANFSLGRYVKRIFSGIRSRLSL